MSKQVIIALLILAAVGSIGAEPASRPARRLKEDAPEDVQKMWEGREARKKQAVAAHAVKLKSERQDLQQLEKGKIDESVRGAASEGILKDPGTGAYTFPSKQIKASAIARQKDDIKKLEDEAKQAAAADIIFENASAQEQVVVGFIGAVGVVNIRQVVDERSAIVRLYTSRTEWGIVGRAGKERAVRQVKSESTDIYLEEIDTAGWVDERGVDPGPIWINGTKTFNTAGGSSRTVLKAVPFKIEDYLE